MDTQDQAQIADASAQDHIRIIMLDTPIKRGESAFSSVTIRRPYGPALRGLSLAKLVNDGDHDSYVTLIPRITEPMITKRDLESGAVDPSDLVRLIGEIGYFFLPKSIRQAIDDSPTE